MRNRSVSDGRYRKRMKIALFTDTLCDANGVSRFLQDFTAIAYETGRELHVYAPTVKPCSVSNPMLHRMPPLLRMRMPWYPQLDLTAPNPAAVGKVLDDLRPDAVHISTPGPTGWIARFHAKKRQLPIVGTYHTDFPRYLYEKTHRTSVETVTYAVMRRFYGDFSMVLTRSAIYRPVLRDRLGLPESKIRILRPGTDTERFSPRYRDTMRWEDFGVSREGLKILYVGRLSEEKRFGLLLRTWQRLYERRRDIQLIVVGEGNRKTVRQAASLPGVVHLGKKTGKALSFCYASADIFVTPSITETLGQTVLEAMASGLPAVVAAQGGHLDFFAADYGAVVRGGESEVWAEAIEHLCRDAAKRRLAGRLARGRAETMSIGQSFEDFWKIHNLV